MSRHFEMHHILHFIAMDTYLGIIYTKYILYIHIHKS
jgi:hypothetical protein